MTTRRNLLALGAGVLAAAALPGCRRAAPAVPDLFFADSGSGLIRRAGTDVRNLGTSAVLSGDGRFLYAVGRGPSLARLDPATGAAVQHTALDDGWLPRVVSANGRACALGRSAASARPAARARTSLLVHTDQNRQRYELSGVIEPDAFTADNRGLVVLEWLPPAAPDHYRVRLLDLGTKQLQPLFTRDKRPVPAGAEEEMSGIGRQAVLSPDRQVLYTLYTHQPGHQHTRNLIAGTRADVHAFVHVLHLVERWAYCLDLPHPFGEGPAAAHAIAADDRHLAVVDVSSGSLLYADPHALTVGTVVAGPKAAGEASLVLTPDNRTMVGAGDTVTVRGGSTTRWTVPGPVRGLGLSPDGARLYAGGTGEVIWLDTASGAIRGRVPVPGLTGLRHVAARG